MSSRVNNADELPDDLSGTVGVTAGASAPEDLVEAVIARLAPRHGVEEVKITDGAFANLTGRIDEIDPARGKLKISVSIFGRFTPVELEYWQVQRLTE